jgi:hypothetical protein
MNAVKVVTSGEDRASDCCGADRGSADAPTAAVNSSAQAATACRAA